jgi:acyl-coenzyme A thioesterase PaaI-like protein
MAVSRTTESGSKASFGLRDLYDRLSRLPLGNRLFDRFAGLYVPHAARMGFRLRSLDAASITVEMPDRRSNRNHLRSLHAMALAHLGEYTSGLLLLYAVQPMGYRTILREYGIEYLAKARGTITGRAKVELPKGSLDRKDVVVKASLTDRSGEEVARVTATWRVGKTPGS